MFRGLDGPGGVVFGPGGVVVIPREKFLLLGIGQDDRDVLGGVTLGFWGSVGSFRGVVDGRGGVVGFGLLVGVVLLVLGGVVVLPVVLTVALVSVGPLYLLEHTGERKLLLYTRRVLVLVMR